MTSTMPLHPIAQHWIDEVLLMAPAAPALELTRHAAVAERVALALTFDEERTTAPGLLHGGVIATLIDTTGAAASASGLTEEDGATGGATTSMTVNYLAPARSSLIATGAVVHRTRSSTLTDIHVTDENGRLVASGHVTSRIFH